MAKFIYMSREGIDKLRNELRRLVEVEQPLLSQKMATAREYGDIAENAEYDVAREEMDHLQRRIARLQETLSRAQLFDPTGLNPEEVTLLSTVELQDLKKPRKVTYTLVSPEEVDVDKHRISVQSPVGQALIGKKAGDKVTVEVPAGVLEFHIISVKRE
ncbi:MAG: transcription elongation factor GreA [Candidatus Zixiibacteriota bacterium]|nr:MAG: transcription elongation factor GreA [candidate division Zixibacteria bacterium]